MPNNRDTRLLMALREIAAQGVTDEQLLIDTAAEMVGGSDLDRKAARKVFEVHFKTFTAN